ncbi:YhgE/Pip domain-containing protein, partial [Candidatus Saccharibacteria bacterium]|nr:YhgE/Pip domain-containing protein [Candidatus Saccharibacteria bacterium]
MKVIEIFKRDVAKIFKSKVAVMIMAGMTIIPGIYAWLNIDSNWNPYDNTGNIEFAVVNKDSGVKILNEDVNIGESLTEALKSNTAMKWVFVDEDTAKDRVESGEYYGAIVLPEDFSNKITSLFDGTEIVKPEFDYYVNNKKNAIAPIITTKAVGTLETTLDQAFVNTVVFKAVDKAEKLNLGDKGTETIDGVIRKLNTAKEDVSQLRATLNVITSATEATANALEAVRGLLPTDESFARLDMNEARENLSSLEIVGEKAGESVGEMFEVADVMSGRIDESLQELEAGDVGLNGKIEKIAKVTGALRTILEKQKNLNSSLRELTGREIFGDLEERQNLALGKLAELDALMEHVSDNGALLLGQVKAKSGEMRAEIMGAKEYYTNEISGTVKEALSKVSSRLDEVMGAFSFTANAFSKTDTALLSTIRALESAGVMNANVDVLLKGLEGDIDKIIRTLGGAGSSDLYLKVLNLLENSPADVADFISKPIKTNQIDYYPIEDYGSKMAPFYT